MMFQSIQFESVMEAITIGMIDLFYTAKPDRKWRKFVNPNIDGDGRK